MRGVCAWERRSRCDALMAALVRVNRSGCGPVPVRQFSGQFPESICASACPTKCADGGFAWVLIVRWCRGAARTTRRRSSRCWTRRGSSSIKHSSQSRCGASVLQHSRRCGGRSARPHLQSRRSRRGRRGRRQPLPCAAASLIWLPGSSEEVRQRGGAVRRPRCAYAWPSLCTAVPLRTHGGPRRPLSTSVAAHMHACCCGAPPPPCTPQDAHDSWAAAALKRLR